MLSNPVNSIPPAIVTVEFAAHKEGLINDTRLKLLQLFCPRCDAVLGVIHSEEVAPRLPGHAPYFVVATQHPTGRVDYLTQQPIYRWVRSLLEEPTDPAVRVLMVALRAQPPADFQTTCRVHGRFDFSRKEALKRTQRVRHKALVAEADKAALLVHARRWYLAQPRHTAW